MSAASQPAVEGPDRRATSTDRTIAVTIFLTGAAVLVLEILGTRLLAPYFGNSIYVWSSLITVTLVALAAGYWLGGVLADTRGEPSLLDRLIACSAIWVAVIPTLITKISDYLTAIDFRAAILLTALIGFGPALLLLGMVTPVAVKLAVRDLTHVGRSSGNVYALSTAGGVFGALTAGFLLFPAVSVTTICILTSLLLLMLALIRWLLRCRRPWLGALPVLLLAGIMLAAPGSYLPRQQWHDRDATVLSNRPSFYGTVRVAEMGDYRMMFIDNLCHTARDIGDGEAAMPHVWVVGALPYLHPDGRTALLIGLGGGDMVGTLHRHGISTAAVELDPVVFETASRYFGFDESDTDVTVADGRFYLHRSLRRFDFVILDAFMGGSVPSHLLSREAFAEMRDHLNPRGILAVNVAVDGHDSPIVYDVAATIRSVFPQLLAVASNPDPHGLGNMIFFASDRPVEIPSTWNPAPQPPEAAATLAALPSLVVDSMAGHGTVATDEWSLIEARSVTTELALRRQAREMLPSSLRLP